MDIWVLMGVYMGVRGRMFETADIPIPPEVLTLAAKVERERVVIAALPELAIQIID